MRIRGEMGGYCLVISDYFTTTKYYSVNGFAMIGVWAIIAKIRIIIILKL